MAMEIEKTFDVDAPPDEVWDFLTDPDRVASCLPGAAITERLGNDAYTGTMKVKVGPVSASYKGKIQFEKLDREAGTAEIVASGQETKGKGGAEMRMTSRVTAREGGGTEVVATSQVEVTGILAQFGRGMIQDVSDRMFEQFTAAVREKLEGGGGEGESAEPADEDEALDVGSIGVEAGKRALGRAVRRLTGRGEKDPEEGEEA